MLRAMAPARETLLLLRHRPKMPVTRSGRRGRSVVPTFRRLAVLTWHTRRRELVCLVLVLLVSYVSLRLRRGVPLIIGNADDRQYIRGANYLVQGDWLGPFDRMTLARGPAYPLFIAMNHALGISLKTGEQLTALAAALVTAACVAVTTRRLWATTATYCFLALNPDTFGSPSAKVMRDGWYSSLTLLLVSSVFLLGYVALASTRLRTALLAGVPLAVLTGIVGAAFWLCREEGLWITPAVLFVVVGLAALVLLVRRRQLAQTEGASVWPGVRRRALQLGVVGLVTAIAFIAPIEMVKARNYRAYGTKLTNDTLAGAFGRAYNDWARVSAGPRPAHLPLTRAMRTAVYAVSPAADELRPFLEDRIRNAWYRLSCPSDPTDPPCDILGYFTLWAVRDAAEAAGHFGSEADLQSFFGELDDEINAACKSGELSCRRKLPGPLETLVDADRQVAVRAFSRLTGTLVWSTASSSPATDQPTQPQAFYDAAAAVTQDAPPSQAAAEQQMRVFRSHLWRYRILDTAYQFALPLLAALALVGTALGLRRGPTRRMAVSILCLGLALGVLARLSMLSILDATSYPTTNPRYLLPGRTLYIAFAVVGTVQLAEFILSRRRRTVPDASVEEVTERTAVIDAQPDGAQPAGAAGISAARPYLVTSRRLAFWTSRP